MIPWTLLDTTQVPSDGGELRLLQRGGEFSIRLGTEELMNSRVHGSEEALAQIACSKIGGLPRPRLLIGGLGMGFTLRAALSEIPAEAEAVVAELIPAVVAWNRGPLASLSQNSLADARVVIEVADVASVMRSQAAAYDAILLDVDNGPRALTHKGNSALYDQAGLTNARTALRPGGVLAIWSAGPDDEFTQRLRRVGFQVEEVHTRARGARGGARHTIWIAT